MKTNLKLSKITISKLDNLNLKPLENGELKNVQGGGDILTVTSGAPVYDTNTNYIGEGPVDIVTIGGSGWNDTSSYSSCTFNINTDCYTKLS